MMGHKQDHWLFGICLTLKSYSHPTNVNHIQFMIDLYQLSLSSGHIATGLCFDQALGGAQDPQVGNLNGNR